MQLRGYEAGGLGIDSGKHAARFSGGRPGVLHGARTYVLQDEFGQTRPSHSVSAGLDYPGVGPEHAYLHDIGRATYEPVEDAEAMDAFALLCRTEGIIPAIESAHALAGALRLARELGPDAVILVSLSGRGDKDVETAARWLGVSRRDPRRAEPAPCTDVSRSRPGTSRAARRSRRLLPGRLPVRAGLRSTPCARWSRAASTSSRSGCRTPTR